ALPQDLARALKGHSHIGHVPGVKEVSREPARRDVIPPTTEKHHPGLVNPTAKQIEELVQRFPVLPDFPLSQESVFKGLANNKGTIADEDEGFKLTDVCLMVLCGAVCGAKKVEEIYTYLQARSHFFTKWLGLKNGLPSYRLLWVVMNRLD